MQRQRPKLLVVGLDGVRADTMALVARRPGSGFGRLMRRGAWSFHARTTARAISGPAWSSVLTGVHPEKHGVVDNDIVPNNLTEFPHLFDRLRDRRTASIVNWAPINEHLIRRGAVDVMEEYSSDARVCERVVKLLCADRDLDAAFVQLDEADAWGHRTGYGSYNPFYRHAVGRADRLLERMVGALEERPTGADEDWLVIATSDHGGRWFSHGADDDANRRVPFVVAGTRAARGLLDAAPAVVDVAATGLHHLGVAIDPGWMLDGVVRGYAGYTTGGGPGGGGACR